MVYIHAVVHDNNNEIEVKVWNLYKVKNTFENCKAYCSTRIKNPSEIGLLSLKIITRMRLDNLSNKAIL